MIFIRIRACNLKSMFLSILRIRDFDYHLQNEFGLFRVLIKYQQKQYSLIEFFEDEGYLEKFVSETNLYLIHSCNVEILVSRT